MRLQAILTLALLATTLFAAEPKLSPRYQTVYILAMNNGLDQHITSRVTSSGALWVVLEPTNADAVITDTLDDAFWTWLGKTYPSSGPTPTVLTPPSSFQGPLFGRESSGRYRGTVFLVDPRRRIVLWSTYVLPRNSGPAELDRTATHVADALKKAFGKK
jgi:hypothetical protein